MHDVKVGLDLSYCREDPLAEAFVPAQQGPGGARSLPASGLTALAALALEACGGDAGTSSAPIPTPIPVPVAKLAAPVAARFLGQAMMGATDADIAHVQTIGFEAWLTEQFGTPRATAHWDWLVAGGYGVVANINSEAGYDASIWRS